MADIYVRPYGERNRNPLRFLLPVLLIAAVLGGGIWWWLERSPAPEAAAPESPAPAVEPSAPASAPPVAPVKKSTPAPAAAPVAPPPSPKQDEPRAPRLPQTSSELEALFDAAQSQFAAGQLTRAAELLGQIIAKAPQSSLAHNALRVQGRVNLKRLFSEAPASFKASYVIQPGDSLDRIAHKNRTTVDLVRRMNGIEGNLIYPGARLWVPAKPFVVHVDKSERILDLLLGDQLFKRYSVGVGRYGKTPVGTFFTVVHQKNPDWTSPSGGIVKFGEEGNVLGTRWMSFQDEARPNLKGFGIHGTADRTSIGREASNGCIRMLNEDVEEVFTLIPRGTKVVIQE